MTTRRPLVRISGKTRQLSSTDTLSSDCLPASIGAGFKNRLINGGFDVWQRGTSFSSGSAYAADRWYLSVGGTITAAQTTSVRGSIPANYGLTWTAGASSSAAQLYQPLEQADVIPLRGQTMTVSAYVAVNSTFSGTAALQIYYSSSSDARASQTSNVASVSFTPTTTLTRYSLTFTVPSDALGLMVVIAPNASQASGASFTVGCAQLETGSSSTAFERRPIGQELALCQRYFERSYDYGTSTGAATEYGMSTSLWQPLAGVNQKCPISFRVSKRASPTMTGYDAGGNAGKCSAWNAANTRTDSLSTSSRFFWVGCNGGFFNDANLGTSYYNFGTHWIADCEL